jgi:hypothetical protein
MCVPFCVFSRQHRSGTQSAAADSGCCPQAAAANTPDEYEMYMAAMTNKVLAPTSYFFETPAAVKRLDRHNSLHPRTDMGRYTCYERGRDKSFLYPDGKTPRATPPGKQKPAVADRSKLLVRADGSVAAKKEHGIPQITVAQALATLARKASEQCAEVGRLFRMYDTDKSGAIDHGELRNMLLNFNIALTDDHYRKFVRC